MPPLAFTDQQMNRLTAAASMLPPHQRDGFLKSVGNLLELAPRMSALIGDKGYDGDGFRAEIVNRGAKPVIPNRSNRVSLHSFSKRAYKGRNVIERCFCRLIALIRNRDARPLKRRYTNLLETK